MDKGRLAAQRAVALVGYPFRPQGRENGVVPGLDCVGLVMAAHRIDATSVRSDYRLRGAYGVEVRDSLRERFRRVFGKDCRPGDVMLLRCAPDQYHLAVVTEDGFVHADAARRMVVHTPGKPRWPLVARFRARRGLSPRKG